MRFDYPITSDASDASRRDWKVFEECTRCHWPMFYNLSSALNTELCDFPGTLARVVDVAVSITRADRGLLLLFDERKGTQRKVGRNAKGQDLPEADLAISRSIVQRVLSTKKPLVIPNIARDPEFSKVDSVKVLELVSVMATPLRLTDSAQAPLERERRALSLRAREEILGVLYVDSKTSRQVYAEMDLSIFEALANYATTVLLYAQLQEEGRLDPLSGLSDRRHFERALASEVELARRTKEPLSVLLANVDGFRQVNQAHGRTVADDVLRTIGGLLKESVRRSDVAARFGGATFAVVLPQTNAEGAKTIAEKVRKRVQQYEFLGGELAVTVSVGTVTDAGAQADASTLAARADQALGVAKKGQGNRVFAWHAGEEGGPRADSSAGILCGEPSRDHERVGRYLRFLRQAHADASVGAILLEAIEAMEAERAFLLAGAAVEGRARGGGEAKEAAATRELLEHAASKGTPQATEGALAVPLAGGRALAVEAPASVRSFDASDLAFLERLAEVVGWILPA